MVTTAPTRDMLVFMMDSAFTEQLHLLFETTSPTIFDYPVMPRQALSGLRRRTEGSSRPLKRKRQEISPDQDHPASEQDYSCVVCRDNVPCVVFKPCSHSCCCASCALALPNRRCPICNETIRQKTRVFFAGYMPEPSIPKKTILE